MLKDFFLIKLYSKLTCNLCHLLESVCVICTKQPENMDLISEEHISTNFHKANVQYLFIESFFSVL